MLKILIILIVIKLFILTVSIAQNDSLSSFTPLENSNLSGHNNKSYTFSTKQLIAPTVMIAYGVAKLNNNELGKIDDNAQDVMRYRCHKTSIDNFAQFAPAATVYGLNMFGVKGRHNYADLTLIYGTTVLLTTAVVQTLKRTTKVMRPDGSSATSFPSGHTATAFAGAEFLRIEYQDVSPWIAVGGYAVASSVGIFRMYNNRHWFSDVVAGAGIGILCTRAVYWMYPSSNFTQKQNNRLKQKQYTTAFLPFYQHEQIGASLVVTF